MIIIINEKKQSQQKMKIKKLLRKICKEKKTLYWYELKISVVFTVILRKQKNKEISKENKERKERKVNKSTVCVNNNWVESRKKKKNWNNNVNDKTTKLKWKTENRHKKTQKKKIALIEIRI